MSRRHCNRPARRAHPHAAKPAMLAHLRTITPEVLTLVDGFWRAGVFDLVAIAWTELQTGGLHSDKRGALTVAPRENVLAQHRKWHLPPRVVEALATPAPANCLHAVVLTPRDWLRVTLALPVVGARGAA